MTDKAISRWERGLGFPDIQTLEPLAQALGISVLELMRSERQETEKQDQQPGRISAIHRARWLKCYRMQGIFPDSRKNRIEMPM